MPRTATHLLPATLTFLIEEQRVCEAEALVRLLSEGNGSAPWTGTADAAWREHLRAHVHDCGPHPVFPLLYVRNTQIPRAVRAFETEWRDRGLSGRAAIELLLEMLRVFALKRKVPLAQFTLKLKRDRVHLITAERFATGRKQLIQAGLVCLQAHGYDPALAAIAAEPQWIVYPIVRDFLAALRDHLAAQGELPQWWLALELKLAMYGEDAAALAALITRIPEAGLSPSEQETVRQRLERRLVRLEELQRKEAERAAKEAAYIDSIRSEWLERLEALPILERAPHAWEEYQDFRDTHSPIAVGTAAELLPQLPRQSTYTVWEVGAILDFVPVKTIRLRPLKTKVRRVNPEDQLSWACQALEHYMVEDGLRKPVVVHYVILRLREDAYALFSLAPPTDPA